MSDRPRIARARVAALALLAIVVLAASALVCSARVWWLGDLAASFRWQLGWLTLAAAVAMLALHTRWLAAGCALLAAVHLAPELRLWWPRDPESRPLLSVATANLLQHNGRFDEVARTLQGLDVDVVAVEELSLAMRETLERELTSWPHRAFSPEAVSAWNKGTWGLGLFSRLPLGEVRRVQLADCYAPSLEVSMAVASRELVIHVVHVPRPGRVWHMQRRTDALEALVSEPGWSPSSILLGDLNLTSTNPGFAALLARTRLSDSRAGFGRQATFTVRKLGIPLSIAIDHALVGSGLEARRRSTFAIPGSDHRGVVLALGAR